MRPLVCLLIMVYGMRAQTPGRAPTVQKVASALTALKELPASEGSIIDPRTLTPESLKRLQAETETSDTRLEQAIAGLVRPSVALYRDGSLSWEAGYTLASALSGKQIEEGAAKHAVDSLFAILDSPYALTAVPACNGTTLERRGFPVVSYKLLPGGASSGRDG